MILIDALWSCEHAILSLTCELTELKFLPESDHSHTHKSTQIVCLGNLDMFCLLQMKFVTIIVGQLRFPDVGSALLAVS